MICALLGIALVYLRSYSKEMVTAFIFWKRVGALCVLSPFRKPRWTLRTTGRQLRGPRISEGSDRADHRI